MKQLFFLILVVTLSCAENFQPERGVIRQLEKLNISPSGNFVPLDGLKSIVESKNQSDKINSMKYFDKDSISDFLFIRDLFPRANIDSIEFYGNFDRQLIYSKSIPEDALLIIYFNQKRLSKNRLNLLEFEWNDRFKTAKKVFEKGGIVFELDGQLCVYSINNCGEKHLHLESIDAEIKAKMNQNSVDYERILTDCGSILFERKLN